MKKKIWVIKLGGGFLQNEASVSSLMLAIKDLLAVGFGIVIIHGGGKQADSMQMKLGIPIKKINGRRITDKKTLDILKMIYKGVVNSDLVSAALKAGIAGFGMTGMDGKILVCERRPVQKITDQKSGEEKRVDFGFVGDIKSFDGRLLSYLLDSGYLPVIACLSADEKGQVLNINADTMAAAVACYMKAERLIFISDVEGIKKDRESSAFFKKLSLSQAEVMIREKKITDGMIPKIENVSRALNGGIGSIQIMGALNGKKEWMDGFINQSFGTVVYGGKYDK
ncbi:acetylglutamate kinase [Patescibacteria group bacterium]|nr:acetylglutamate kinase [Patescibacteria group bacterium]